MVFRGYASLRASEYIQDRLNVSGRTVRRISRLRSFIRFGGGFDVARSRFRGPFGGSRRLRSVLPNVSRKDFHNRAVVSSWEVLHREGVPGDPFEGVDAAETYFHPFVSLIVSLPQLVDRPREAFRDLLVARSF